jgi:hypothetical protein
MWWRRSLADSAKNNRFLKLAPKKYRIPYRHPCKIISSANGDRKYLVFMDSN